MAIYFKRPNTTRDWSKTIERLSLASIAAIGLDIVGSYQLLKSAIADSNSDLTVDEIAWVWMRVSLALAIYEFAEDVCVGHLSDRKQIANEFAAQAMELSGTQALDGVAFRDPSSSPALDDVFDKIPEFIRGLDPQQAKSDSALRRRFSDKLSLACARVNALDTSFYRPVFEALHGLSAEAASKVLAWSRHEKWIAREFTRPIILSGGRSASLPSLYEPLRTTWYEHARFSLGPDTQTVTLFKVAYLERKLREWVATTDRDSIRLVAGGPGSGKSTTAKALAFQCIKDAICRVVYVPMETMTLSGDLFEDIGKFLQRRWNATSDEGGAGFPENPLLWRQTDRIPYLMIFDGLDELPVGRFEDRDRCYLFGESLQAMLNILNQTPPMIKAVVFGRTVVCQEIHELLNLKLNDLLTIAPLTPIKIDDYRPALIDDPEKLLSIDQRDAFIRRYRSTTFLPRSIGSHLPEHMSAISADPMSLAIISDVVSDSRYDGASLGSISLIYDAMWESIYEELSSRPTSRVRIPPRDHFFIDLECLGLAAHCGAGRVATTDWFNRIKEIVSKVSDSDSNNRTRMYVYDQPIPTTSAIYNYLDLQRQGDGNGYTFTHKGHSEYFAARCLIAMIDGLSRSMSHEEARKYFDDVWLEMSEDLRLSSNVWTFMCDMTSKMDLSRLERLHDLLTALGATFIGRQRIPNGQTRPAYIIQEKWARSEENFLAISAAVRRAILALIKEEGICVTAIKLESSKCARAVYDRISTLPSELRISDLMSTVELTGADLRGAAINGLDVGASSVHDVSFAAASMTGAYVRSSIVYRVCFDIANLIGTRFDRVEARNLSFVGSDMSGVQIEEVQMHNCNFADAMMAGLFLMNSEFSSCRFTGAKLQSAMVKNARIMSSIFNLTDLSKAGFECAVLGGSRFDFAQLDDVHFSQCNLIGVGFQGASLRFSHFQDSDLTGSDFTNARLDGALFLRTRHAGWRCPGASFRFADLSACIDVSEASLRQSFGVREGYGRTTLPSAIDYPQHWHSSVGTETFAAHEASYEAALLQWRASIR